MDLDRDLPSARHLGYLTCSQQTMRDIPEPRSTEYGQRRYSAQRTKIGHRGVHRILLSRDAEIQRPALGRLHTADAAIARFGWVLGPSQAQDA